MILWLSSALFLPAEAQSQDDSVSKPEIVRLEESTEVFLSLREEEPMATLPSGTKVHRFRNSSGQYKVEWLDPVTKKKLTGVIKSSSQQEPAAKPAKKQLGSESFAYKKWGAGLGIMVSQLTWGQRTVSVGTEDVYEISAMTSQTTMPTLQLQYFLNPNRFLDFALGPRTTLFTGTAELQDSFLGKQDSSLSHSMIAVTTGFGFVLKKIFFASAFVEWAKATTVSATINNDEELPTEDLDLPLFIMIGGSAGMWFNFTGNFYVSPAIRFATIVNTQPGILGGEFIASGGLRF
jgi:hypothetical protein